MKALSLSCLAALVALTACSRSNDKVTVDLRRSASGTPLATYAGGILTVEDVNKTVAQLPPMVRMRFQSPAQKKEFVERLITLDLLAREAVREGHANDPEVVESLKNVLAQKVVKDERENKSPVVTDEEVQAWYEGHAAEFTRPETWRLSAIFVALPANDPAKDKVQTAKADKLLGQAQKLKADDFAGFGQLAKANSEDPSKAMEGDLRALTAADLTSRYGAEVAQAAAALKSPGDTAGLIHSKNGVYILKLRAHTSTMVASLNDVKPQIRTRLQNDHRNAAYEKFIADLKTKAGVQIDEAALAKVLVDASGPQGGPPMPRMMVPGQPPAPTQIPALPSSPSVAPAPTPPSKP